MSFEAIIFEPLSFVFMQRALLMAVLTAAVCAVLSCYLVLKGWALMGDAVSHAVLPGIVLAHVLALPLSIGAFVAGLFSAVATGYLNANSRIKEDTAMGIVFSGMLALGLVLYLKVETDQHLDQILFGNLLGVRIGELVEVAVVSAVVIGIVVLKRRDLLLYCFDPDHARAIGLRTNVLYYGLLVLLALAIVASIKTVGIILVVALLIGPGAAGYLVSNRFDRMLIVAVSVAISASVIGTLLSYHIDGATGPCIVLVQAGLVLAAFAWSRIAEQRSQSAAKSPTQSTAPSG
ncbi:MAG: metal ABC transporter permease [Pseudomonadota bacterium]